MSGDQAPIKKTSIKITSSGKELLSSGSFMSFDEKETVLEVSRGGDHLNLIFNFIHDPNIKGYNTDFQAVGPDTLRLNLTNYKGPLGMYLKEPVEIGTFNNRRIYLNYYVTSPLSRPIPTEAGQRIKVKVVHYSIFLGENVTNG